MKRNDELTAWTLRDGKRGHEDQVLGLAEAIARRAPLRVESVLLPHEEGLPGRFRRLQAALRQLPRPELILAAGHKTHLLLLYAARRTGARSILLMKPTLPELLFDVCIVPAHDLSRGAGVNSRRIITLGALNRVRYDPGRKDGRGLFLIGGPSREHGWDGAALIGHLRGILAAEPRRQWILTTSRRTPAEFLTAAREQLGGIQCVDDLDTDVDWLPAQLARAEVVWVTRDSASMVYEALSAGARVGLLDVPLRGRPGKLTRGLKVLLRDRYVSEWALWREMRQLATPPRVLAESDRCAEEILERLGQGVESGQRAVCLEK